MRKLLLLGTLFTLGLTCTACGTNATATTQEVTTSDEPTTADAVTEAATESTTEELTVEEDSTNEDTTEELTETDVPGDASEGYTLQELEMMALDYYEKVTNYRPTNVASIVNDDGTVSIQLYDSLSDHNSTCAWYTIDPKTGKGTDDMTNEPIDLVP